MYSQVKARAIWTFTLFHPFKKQKELFCQTFSRTASTPSEKLLLQRSQSRTVGAIFRGARALPNRPKNRYKRELSVGVKKQSIPKRDA